MDETTKEIGGQFQLTRRATLSIGASLIVMHGRPLYAQADEAYRALLPVFEGAIKVRDYAIDIPLSEIDYAVIGFIELDYYSRREALSKSLETGIFSSSVSAKSYIASIPELFQNGDSYEYDDEELASQRVVVDLLEENGVPITPPQEFVTPVNIPAIPPYEDQVEHDLSGDLIVVFDIFLETLGISLGEESLIEALVDSDRELKSRFEKLVGAITSKDWREVVGLVEAIFKLFVASSVWAKVKGTALKKLSWRLAFKAVPVVGWLYCGAAFVVSVKKNYHRFSFAETKEE
ncbi:hypothetical protein LCM08_26415 [Salipiger pacificus]|nr:hypothetical protein [Alloyangia pacifica]